MRSRSRWLRSSETLTRTRRAGRRIVEARKPGSRSPVLVLEEPNPQPEKRHSARRASFDFVNDRLRTTKMLHHSLTSRRSVPTIASMSTPTRFPPITAEALTALRSRIGQPVRRPEPYIEVATPDAIRHWAHGIGDRNPHWAEAGLAPPT